jgi:hypothetical protein
MDLLMFRCAWLVVASGAAYAAVVFRRVVLRQRHPLDWPVDLEVSRRCCRRPPPPPRPACAQ